MMVLLHKAEEGKGLSVELSQDLVGDAMDVMRAAADVMTRTAQHCRPGFEIEDSDILCMRALLDNVCYLCGMLMEDLEAAKEAMPDE